MKPCTSSPLDRALPIGSGKGKPPCPPAGHVSFRQHGMSFTADRPWNGSMTSPDTLGDDRRNRSRPTSFRSHEKEEGLSTENGRTMRTSMISCIPEGTRSMCSPLPTYRHADGNGTRYSSSSSSSRTESATFMPSIGKARSMTAL